MARPVMLGNGSLTVGLNEHGLVHDFYYPYVGLDNLTTSRSAHHNIGVWADGVFSWADDGSWQTSVDFEERALVSKITLENDSLQIKLTMTDFVDPDINAFCRTVSVTNLDGRKREVRLFMHQVFQISRAGRADTALFVPEENYILDYKGRCSLLIYGVSSEGQVFDQFAIGNYGIEGKEGTFKDAEDGELSGSAVEHGGVDSVIRFRQELDHEASLNVDYWVVAAESQERAEHVHDILKEQGISHRLSLAREYWRKWLAIGSNQLANISDDKRPFMTKSLMIIKSHIDRRGGIIASCDSSIYNYGRDYYTYVWPRDGAYVIWPLIRLGYKDEPKKFFEFCRDILSPDGYLMHKYQPDKAIGSTWHPLLHGKRKELAIQEDETAIVLYMLGEYFKYSGDEEFVQSLYATFIQPAANFMSGFIDEQTGLPHASYDLWEEKFLTNSYTAAVVHSALNIASDFAERFDYPDDAVRWRKVAEVLYNNSAVFFDPGREVYRKGYLLSDDGSLNFDNTLDVSSFYGAFRFGLIQPTKTELTKTLSAIENELLDQSPTGGAVRYENDNYFASDPAYKGNPWFVATLWLVHYYSKNNQLDKANKYIDWTLQHALPSGVLPEQVNPTDGNSISVAPLIWSHAELINALLDVADVTSSSEQNLD